MRNIERERERERKRERTSRDDRTMRSENVKKKVFFRILSYNENNIYDQICSVIDHLRLRKSAEDIEVRIRIIFSKERERDRERERER